MPANADDLSGNEDLDSADKIRAGLKGDEGNKDDAADDDGDDTPIDDKPVEKKISDNEAKLLKEVMKHKDAAKKAAADLKALQDRFDGIDVDAVKEMLKQKEDAENNALEKKGEYDRLLAKQREAADAKVSAEKERADKAEADRANLLKQIEDLTTGNAFSNSKFVSEKLTLTPNKAKALYKSHFEFVDGKMVAYDKPKGEGDRTLIVDASGEPVDFEAAIATIIDADPDKDYLLKAEQKPGAASKPAVTEKVKKQEFVDTTDKIAAGLEALTKLSAKK